MNREKFEDLDDTMQNDYRGDQYESDEEMNFRQQEANYNDDLAKLKQADYQMPDTHKEKQLRACCSCRLIMSDSQWNKKSCPNCREERPQVTSQFTGMISLCMPSNSWVAKWNNLEGREPGIYAISILEEYAEHDDYQQYNNQSRKKNKSKKGNTQAWSDDEDYGEEYA